MPSSRAVDVAPTCKPVQLADEPVERPAERLDVQHGRGDLAERQVAVGVPPGAHHEGEDAGGVEGDVDDREEQVAQRHGVALGLGGDGDVVVALGHAATGQAEGLDGAGALDGLGQRRVDPGVRRALGDVAPGSTAEVAADREVAGADDEQGRHRQQHRVEQHRDHGQGDGQQRDDRHRQTELDRPAHGADVAGHPRDEVAGAGALHLAQRQAEDRADDVLPCGREQVLPEERRGPLGEEGEERLRHHHADDQQRDLVEARPVGVHRAVDEVAQQPGYDERGGRRESVEHHEGHEGATAFGDEAPGEAQDRTVAGDGPAAFGMTRRLVDAFGLLAAKVVPQPPRRESLRHRRIDRRHEPRVHDGSVAAVVGPGLCRGAEQVGGHVVTSSSIDRATTARYVGSWASRSS